MLNFLIVVIAIVGSSSVGGIVDSALVRAERCLQLNKNRQKLARNCIISSYLGMSTHVMELPGAELEGL